MGGGGLIKNGISYTGLNANSVLKGIGLYLGHVLALYAPQTKIYGSYELA